jgi:hypothetical protein
LRIGLLDLSDVVEGSEVLGKEMHPDCLLALGAALRVESSAL